MLYFVWFRFVSVWINIYCTFLSDASQVIVKNFVSVMETVMRPYVNLTVRIHTRSRKRVGVLISDNGTNLQVFY